ncbi:peptidase T [Rubrivirga litoralis]|uniref:Peptidase T n=1 Tax=Rubrivirga litoralis TaxID=3075598 RepID=A0ABU3BSJ5_9BACT|nr:peptidase T [Rubrivirga sp. F394]MDT0632243.1 peptidase T [Rubrivirga sp. F394]
MPVPYDDLPDLPPVVRRFCRYAEVWTTSDPDATTFPSTERQKDLSRILVDELRALGAADAEMDAWGYVTATLPAPPGSEGLPVVALVAHVDTSPDAPGQGVRPHVHEAYAGGAVAFPGAPDLVLDPERQPALREHVGEDLLTSDGTTLLGSDDKAGVAVIVQLAADLARAEEDARRRGERPAPRPTIRVLFTPDEEVGRGTEKLDLDRLGADVAYTLDGSGVDRLNVETFNAAEARLVVEGVGVHPGYAKGVLVNALRVAAEFVAALPRDEAPETTEGREGYLHPHTLSGTAERAELRVLLRDFTDDGMEAKRRLVRDLADRARRDWPGATVGLEIRESYRNMLSYIEETDRRVIDLALAAGRSLGVELELEPVRGGTDGARLSERGLPTPNVFTGGYDFHSRFEWNTVQNLERALAYTHALVQTWGREAAPTAPPRP